MAKFPQFRALGLSLLTALGWAGPTHAQDAETGRSTLPVPSFADVVYGPVAANVMDVWLAAAGPRTPVLVYFHGGGFVAGSKANLPPALLAQALHAGISVVSVSYRLAPKVVFPTHYLDCARAIQYARYRADLWNIDPRRVALTGSSAGGAASLWIAFHDDLAEPNSPDPIARESTRVSCAAVTVAQPTYDPAEIRRLVSDSAARHPVFLNLYGLKADEVDTPRAHALYRAAAPITYLTSDDPPVFAYYGGARTLPPADAKAGEGIHHPNLGIYLKQRMDAVHVECVLKLKEDGGNATASEIAFLRSHLGLVTNP